MTRDLGRAGAGRARRLAGRWAGGFAALLLTIATPAAALQQRPTTTTTVPTVAAPTVSPTATAPRTYAECLRSYVGRTDASAYCRRLFPDAPAAATSSTAAPAGAASTPEPVDITPQLNGLFESWQNRPRPPRPPADPLAVVPEIQAACAPYAGVPERWRRCVADAWRTAGLRGAPPLVLQNPPVVAPPPVVQPPRPVQPPVVSPPPVQTPPTLRPEPVTPPSEPIRPVPVVEPDLPPVAVVEPPPAPTPPPTQPPPPAQPPAVPIWPWLVALVAAAAAGFGLARMLTRSRPPSSRPSKVEAAPCVPDIALVAAPGVVVLIPDGPPRAGMALSLRIERDPDGGEVRLDYPTLETAP